MMSARLMATHWLALLSLVFPKSMVLVWTSTHNNTRLEKTRSLQWGKTTADTSIYVHVRDDSGSIHSWQNWTWPLRNVELLTSQNNHKLYNKVYGKSCTRRHRYGISETYHTIESQKTVYERCQSLFSCFTNNWDFFLQIDLRVHALIVYFTALPMYTNVQIQTA